MVFDDEIQEVPDGALPPLVQPHAAEEGGGVGAPHTTDQGGGLLDNHVAGRGAGYQPQLVAHITSLGASQAEK